jgi:hypothetical protein
MGEKYLVISISCVAGIDDIGNKYIQRFFVAKKWSFVSLCPTSGFQ